MITQENKPLENRAKETCRSMKLANELRIGNEITLYRYFITPHYMPYKISAGFDIDQTIRGEWLAEGTPLTEQWLLDFGFKSWQNGDFTLMDYELSRYKGASEIWYIDIQYSENSKPICNIKYVHELQNLWFCLTKMRLTK